MTLTAGQASPFYCVRCGQPYDVRTHPRHPADGNQPPLLSRADTLLIRQQALAGLLGTGCPVCHVGAGEWCREATGGENAKATHAERLARWT